MVERNDIINRLQQLGYKAPESDYEQIEFELLKITNYALNYCNISAIPPIIEPKLIDRVCSEFLFLKKNAGQLGEDFDFEAPAKIIKEGDTSITMSYGEGGKTPEQRFDNMVENLQRSFDKLLTRHRRLSW